MAGPTKDLKKKGLRPNLSRVVMSSFLTNQRPEKEGIKTERQTRIPRGNRPTKDLKKKGLRPMNRLIVAPVEETNQRPEKEGIKTTVMVDRGLKRPDQPKT